MGVKYSQLPSAVTLTAEDQYAVLDVSENVLKKSSIMHASETSEFGLGSETKYGHVKIIDNLDATEFVPGESLAARQGKVISNSLTSIRTDVTTLKNGGIQLAVNPTSTSTMNIWIEN